MATLKPIYRIPKGKLETNLSDSQRYPWNQFIGSPTVPLKPINRIPNGTLETNLLSPNGKLETNLSDSQRKPLKPIYRIPNGKLETNLSDSQRYPWNQFIGFPTVPLKLIYLINNVEENVVVLAWKVFKILIDPRFSWSTNAQCARQFLEKQIHAWLDKETL